MLSRLGAIGALGLVLLTAASALAEDRKVGPADGFTIHVMAPHKFEDETVHGPYHHYCKGISPEILQCLVFESTDSNALLTDIEYFVAKPIARELPLNVWNQFYHDHEVEIATGRVQVLDMPEAKAKEVAAAAAKTDGIIFHLWPQGAPAPTGEVGHPQSVGHKPRTQQ